MERQLLWKRLVMGTAAAVLGMTVAACGSGGSTEVAADTGSEDVADADDGATGTDGADPAAFFEGKTITMVVPYNPGGGFDNFVRLLAPHLEAELDGVQVVVENSPGGGGMIGANEIYQADPDGLKIGLINYPGAVFAEATGAEGVTFTNSDWTFLARLGAIPPLVFTGEDTPYTDFQSMIDAEEPIRFGVGGAGSDAYYATLVMSEVLGFPADIITGYPGGAEADAALLVGEIEASVNSVEAALNRIEGTGVNMNVLVSTEKHDAVPDVPLITEFGEGDQQPLLQALAAIYDLERLLVAPPGMDAARADYLAEAVFAAASSDGYREDMEKAGLTANPRSREDVVSLANAVNDSIDLLVPILERGES